MTTTPIGKHMVAQPTRDGWLVCTKRVDSLLGMVEWRAKWRQFEFVPATNTAFTHDCLTAMAEFLTVRTAERLAAQRTQTGGA